LTFKSFFIAKLLHEMRKNKNMRQPIRLIFAVFLTTWYQHLPAQQLHYSAKEAKAIHDSIHQSRWDIGGSLSHYSFRHMSEFFPVGLISKSNTPYPFLYKPKKSFDNLTITTKKESISFEDYLKKLHINSLIVIQKGTIVYEKYFTMLPEDKHTLQSITKVITSTLITNLINEKKIDIHQSIEYYIPELKNTDWQGISVKDILNMRSGIDNKSTDMETGPFTNPQHKNYQFESALGALPKAANTPESVYQYMAEIKRDSMAGVETAYSNINSFVLGWLAEKLTGKKYVDLISERIWQPMGASSDAYVCLSDKGEAWSHGGISATLRDLARFGMLFTKSEIQKRNESFISFQQLNEIFDAPPIENSSTPFKWAYQWDLAMNGIIMKGGFGGQALYIDIENEIVIAFFNYIDKDWGMNIISETALYEILNAARAEK
jgi:CubicO group peptidase (beta-lactamase class C family)